MSKRVPDYYRESIVKAGDNFWYKNPEWLMPGYKISVRHDEATLIVDVDKPTPNLYWIEILDFKYIAVSVLQDDMGNSKFIKSKYYRIKLVNPEAIPTPKAHQGKFRNKPVGYFTNLGG